jgi:hypothetical protein
MIGDYLLVSDGLQLLNGTTLAVILICYLSNGTAVFIVILDNAWRDYALFGSLYN